MKKIICLLALGAILTGCSSNTVSESKSDSESVSKSISEPVTESPTVSNDIELLAEDCCTDCDWGEQEFYDSIEDFLIYAQNNMFYSEVGESTDPIIPYVPDYDAEKYELYKVIRLENYQYTYIFLNKETEGNLKFSFSYSHGDTVVDAPEKTDVIDLSGFTEGDILLNDYEYRLSFYPEKDCKLYISYSECWGRNVDFPAKRKALKETTMQILSDFTFAKTDFSEIEG